MPIYDGVVTVAEDDIPVLIELDDDIIRLSASGQEIGQWRTDECEISHAGDSTYNIRAENETLAFIPNEPSLFAAAVDGTGSRHRHLADDGPPEPEVQLESESQSEPEPQFEPELQSEPESQFEPELRFELGAEPVPDVGPVLPETPAPETEGDQTIQAPPPKPVTMGLFYALCVLTVALAAWALVSMIF
jgi:hypothetical protein